MRAGTLPRHSTYVTEDPEFASLRQGLLELLTLAAVEYKARYAAEIVTALREVGYPVQEGTVYPLLNKLRRAGLIDHEWRESTLGPQGSICRSPWKVSGGLRISGSTGRS